MLAVLQNFQSIHDMKIVGAILNSLFQCDERMIEAGIYTKEKFKSGKEELLDRMASFFELKSEGVVVDNYGAAQRRNKWSKIKDTRYKVSQTEMACK